jgi:hypothetical protein
MHLSDRRGNMAVVNASGIRLSEAKHQVSTNFNVLARGSDSGGRTCWRYPIAQRMLGEQGASFENIRKILDATQQPRFYGTIYSNVINLTSGDVYNYFAGDFEHPFHFMIGDLLRKGKKSYPFRSLFSQAPIVRIWETYQTKGAAEAVALFRESSGTLTEKRRAETLRHIFSSCLLRLNKFRDARIFFDEWLKVSGGRDRATKLYRALIHLSNGDYEGSKAFLREQIEADAVDEPTRMSYPPLANDLLARLEGERPVGSNARFDLKGYQKARFVGLFLVDEVPVLHAMLRTPDGWHGDFALPPGRNPYAFIVDGEMILDSSNSEREAIETEDGRIKLNIKEVK